MTREEELYEQSKIYLHDAMQEDDFGASGDLDEIKQAFQSGAEWADSHPLNPWKSVKEELPECDMLMIDYHGIPMVAQYYTDGYDTKSWWDINGESYMINEIRDRFTHFMPIPELPKEDTK